MREIVHYPDRRCLELRQDLAAYHHLTPEEILVGNGSTELIYLVARALRTPAGPDRDPGLQRIRARPEAWPGCRWPFRSTTEAHNFTLPEVSGAPSRRPGLPGPPRQPQRGAAGPGAVPGGGGSLDAAGAYLLLDEAFVDFVEEASFKTHLARFPRLLILRSFTKFFGIPGMRLGCLLAAPELVARLAEAQEPWSVNTMAQVMGRACLAGSGVHGPYPDPDPSGAGISLGPALAALPGLHPVSQRGELSPGEADPAGS